MPAFRALVTEWDCFKLQDGSGTKEGLNKRLVAADDATPDALWQIYAAETGETATIETTVAESSKRSNEVR